MAALAPEVKLREVWAWSMYDFANSAYTTVVITAVFGAYFVGVVAEGQPWATFAWADAHAAKKPLLLATTVGCVIFTAALYYAGPGAIALSLALLIVSNYFFGAGENLIAAFLPALASSQAMGRV